MSSTPGEPPSTPPSVAQAKLRLREWGVESEIAHREWLLGVQEKTRAMRPWAIATAAVTGLFAFRGLFNPRSSSPRKEPLGDQPGSGSFPRLGHALRLALKFAPVAIDLFLRSSKAQRRS